MGLIYRNGIPYGGGGSDIEQFIGTTAEWNALPDEEKNKYIDREVILTDDGSGSGSSSKEVYSTEETVIGTWIDDKPIYRKVVTNLQVAINKDADWTNIHAESSVDALVDIKPYTNNGIWYGSVIYKIESGYLKGYSTGLNTIITGYIIEYTKTTD